MKRFATLLLAGALAADAAASGAPLPERLSGTGLFTPGTTAVAPGRVEFAPRYPLWTDGASKRRWIALPPGASVDTSRVDAWDFPPGTRLWKQFGYERPVETRFIERLADGSWRFATYVWNAEGTDAMLAPAEGVALRVASAPGGVYAVPSRSDCVVCHEGPKVPVLGYSAVQLGDALASAAANDDERRALGYLHGNCGHCHNDHALGGVGLVLAQEAANPHASRARTLASLRPRLAELERRLRSTNPMVRMPPLGTRAIDDTGLALIERWVHRHEPSPENRP